MMEWFLAQPWWGKALIFWMTFWDLWALCYVVKRVIEFFWGDEQ
jgi:hypothetical protein